MSVSEGLSQMCCSTTVVHQSDNFSSYFPCKFDDCQFGKFRSIYLWARLNGLNFLTIWRAAPCCHSGKAEKGTGIDLDVPPVFPKVWRV